MLSAAFLTKREKKKKQKQTKKPPHQLTSKRFLIWEVQ